MSHDTSTPLTRREETILTTALDRGYFDVPRRVALSDLADDLDMTAAELSERLRQGTATVLRHHRDETRPAGGDH
jgi:predicted DNA binding protein